MWLGAVASPAQKEFTLARAFRTASRPDASSSPKDSDARCANQVWRGFSMMLALPWESHRHTRCA